MIPVGAVATGHVLVDVMDQGILGASLVRTSLMKDNVWTLVRRVCMR